MLLVALSRLLQVEISYPEVLSVWMQETQGWLPYMAARRWQDQTRMWAFESPT